MTAMTHQIFGLFAETPLHAGGGSKDGVIDLPIQREIHSGWPCVYGSSMKGALRARADQLGVEDGLKTTAFGPDTLNASDHAGALLVGDARLLLLPVRSLTGHFRLVTCPALLRRFMADRARAGLAGDVPAIPEVEQGSALVANPQGGEIFLEEFCFTPEALSAAEEWAALAMTLIAPVPGLEANDVRQSLLSQLAVVDDDSFSLFCRSAIPVLPHVRINSKTKTVDGGALWHEESLPPDTLLYCVVAAQPPRSERHRDTLSSGELLEQTCEALFSNGSYLQVGGNETTGMGWCRVARVSAEGKGGDQ